MIDKNLKDVISNTIIDGLKKDGVVKIKGLGTFKMIEVKARKSVNVRNGEEIEIPAHNKITFTPDNDFAEMVNAPLSHLSIAHLNDNNEYSSLDNSETIDREELEPEEKGDGINEEAMKKLASDAEELKSILAQMSAVENDIETAAKKDPMEERMQVRVNTYRPAAKEKKCDVKVELLEKSKEEGTPVHVHRYSKVKRTILAALLIIVALFVLFVVYVFVRTIIIRNQRAEYLRTHTVKIEDEEDIIEIVGSDLNKEGESVIESNDTVAEKSKQPIETKSTVEVTTPVQTNIPSNLKSANEPIQTNKTTTTVKPKETSKDDNVTKSVFDIPRTYNATLKEITVKDGDRLVMYALESYGSKDFWVYIYEANRDKLKSPGILPTGVKIKVPKMDSRLVDPNSQEALDFARKLAKKY